MQKDSEDSSSQQRDYGELTPVIVDSIFTRLSLRDLVVASSTCSAWNRCLPTHLRTRALARWKHWLSPHPPPDAPPTAWRDEYARRHKLDAHVLQLLATDACWPDRNAAAFTTILSYGADALDVLAAAAKANRLSGMYLGSAHHAHVALLLIQGQLARERIKQLLVADHAGSGAGDAAAAGAGAAAAAAAAAAAEEAQEVEEWAAGLSDRLSTAVHLSPQDDDDAVLEVALQLNLALHPLADIAAVRTAVHELGNELCRRMEAAGAARGSQQALRLLNQLMFGAPQATVGSTSDSGAAAANSTCAAGSSSSSSSGNDSSSGGGVSSWSDVWPRDPGLCADLSGFAVPTDGVSGLGWKGDPEVFSQTSGSCLDSVLADGTGLPISLAILHRAVGRRAGLQIELVNMPGHVVNRVQFSTSSSSSSDAASSSSSSASTAVYTYVDAFEGVELDDAALSELWRRVNRGQVNLPPIGPLWHLQVPDMPAEAVVTRMLTNLYSLYNRNFNHAASRSGLGVSALSAPLVQLVPTFVRGYVHELKLELLSLLQETACGRGDLFYTLLKQQDDLLTEGALARASAASQGILPPPYSSLCQTQYNPAVLQRSQQRAFQFKLPVSSRVSWSMAAGVVGTGFVTGWQPPGGLEPHLCYVLSATTTAPACRMYLVDPDQLLPASGPDTDTSSTSTCPWEALPGALDAFQAAQQLLAQSWFEAPELWQEELAALNSRHGQEGQGQVHTVSSHTSGVCLTCRSLEDICACGAAVGLHFEGAWFDAAGTKEWCLVPNAFLRRKYPQG